MSGAFSVPFAALTVFVKSTYARIIWGLMAVAALLFSAFLIWARERKTVIELREKISPKIQVNYDRNEPSCNAVVSFTDGTRSRCVRLEVQNSGTSRIERCEAWCKIKQFPNISSYRLFWVGPSSSGALANFAGDVDLIKGVPRFVQLFRIHKSNRVIPATEGEVWPIDAMDKFSAGEYQFDIAFKGRGEADTVSYSIKLNWTGNWETGDVTITV